jgi:hypothetical protein
MDIYMDRIRRGLFLPCQMLRFAQHDRCRWVHHKKQSQTAALARDESIAFEPAMR